MTKVFISYGRRDRKIAESLCNWLETRGIPCWIAPRDIHSGISYAGEITRAIRAALLVVVICSKNASRSEHVKTELNLAFNSSKFILPYCLDDTPFGDDLEYYLSFKQRIPYSGDYDKDFALIEKIILSQRDGTVSPVVSEFHPKGHKDRKALYFVIPLLGILAIIAFLQFPSRSPEIPPITEPAEVPHAAIETVVVVEKPVFIQEKVVKKETAIPATDTLLPRINNITPDAEAVETLEKTSIDAVQELLHQLPDAKTLSDIQDLLLTTHTDAPILSGPVTLSTRQKYVDGGFLVFYAQASDSILEIMTPRDSLGVRTNIRSGSSTDPMKYRTAPAYWIYFDKARD